MTDRLLFIVIFVIIICSFSYRKYAVSRRDAYLLRIGLACTLAADFCMLVIYNNKTGLMLFICVQTIYMFRHMPSVSKASVFLLVPFGIYAILSRFTPLTFEARLAAAYACALISSVLSAFICRKCYPFPNNVFIKAGMLMFLLCDVNVALMNILPEGVGKSLSRILIWVFYLPSQALLSASGAKIKGGFIGERN